MLAYWPILLLLYLPWLAQHLTVLLATRTRDRLDHAIPDELPMTAGQWLDKRIAELGLDLRSIVTDRADDGFRPYDKLIQLRATTHFKADPVYWATAAHELGHARVRAKLPIVGHLRTVAGIVSIPLLALGLGLFAGYLLYGLPVLGDVAFVMLAAAASTRIFVLLDEALASVLAYQELRANDAIDFVHLRAIRAVLVLWFATYFVTYVSHALLLAWWPVTIAPTPIDLTTTRIVAAAVLTAGCLASVAFSLRDAIAPHARPERSWKRDLVHALPSVLFLYLVWNASLEPFYIACVVLAIAASWRSWHVALRVPMLLPFAVIVGVLDRFRGPGVQTSSQFLRARRDGVRVVAEGNAYLDALARKHRTDPRWIVRLQPLGKLAFVPLLVAFWVLVLA